MQRQSEPSRASGVSASRGQFERSTALGLRMRQPGQKGHKKIRHQSTTEGLAIIEEMEAHGDDGREPGDTRDEESLEDHNIQGLGAYRDVFDAGGEQ